MNDQAIEQEIQAKGKTAPRITPSQIDANIADTEIVKHVTKSGQVLRWAILTTASGFAVVGKPSASVSPENDDAEIGEKCAIDNSRDEMWPMMGYALKQKLHDAACEHALLHGEVAEPASTMPAHQQRVHDERADLVDKVGKLALFTETPTFTSLPDEEQARLGAQLVAMRTYSDILGERIAAF